jgi:hypothetical protein
MTDGRTFRLFHSLFLEVVVFKTFGLSFLACCSGVVPVSSDGSSVGGSEVVPCVSPAWSDWGVIPGCDLDGSQVWILRQKIVGSGVSVSALRVDCLGAGGVFAVELAGPLTALCIDVDY